MVRKAIYEHVGLSYPSDLSHDILTCEIETKHLIPEDNSNFPPHSQAHYYMSSCSQDTLFS
jgi:hypothetical protein